MDEQGQNWINILERMEEGIIPKQILQYKTKDVKTEEYLRKIWNTV
jgi:hypothetical protein